MTVLGHFRSVVRTPQALVVAQEKEPSASQQQQEGTSRDKVDKEEHKVKSSVALDRWIRNVTCRTSACLGFGPGA